jgi:ribonuclease R
MAGEIPSGFIPDGAFNRPPLIAPQTNYEPQQIDDGFSKSVLLQAETIRLTPDIFEERLKVPVMQIAIDGPTTKDRDDLIGLKKEGNCFLPIVSIADVSALIPIYSPIDIEASKRAFTEYLSWGNKPMIPRSLSEDKLSLHEKEQRPTLTISRAVELDTDENGQDVITNLGQIYITQTISESKQSLSYSDADVLVQNGSDELSIMLKDSLRLAKALLQRRAKRATSQGSLAVFDLRNGIRTTEEGNVKTIDPSNAYLANMIIREFMIFTNEAVAEHLSQRGIAVLFRNHSNLNTRAFYDSTPSGHAGLGLSKDHPYLHFTSPIRRYADLIVQRQLTASLQGKPLPYTQQSLEELSTGINSRDRVTRARKADYLKKIYETAVTAMLDTDFTKLSSKEFSQVVKLAAKTDQISIPLETAILERLIVGQPEKLDNHDLYILLSKVPKSKFTARLLNILARKSHQYRARDILSRAANIRGWKMEITKIENKYTVNLSTEKRSYQSKAFANRNRACLDLLRKLMSTSVLLEDSRH